MSAPELILLAGAALVASTLAAITGFGGAGPTARPGGGPRRLRFPP